MRVLSGHIAAPLQPLAAGLLLLASSANCAAQMLAPVAHTTLVVFSDRPTPEGFSQDLESALRKELSSNTPEMQVLDPQFQFLRGDQIAPGIATPSPIPIFLKGDCTPAKPVRQYSFGEPIVDGPLGWVIRDHGYIEGFIHVDCTRIGRVIGPRILYLDSSQRVQCTASAVARVVLHEWIHIATQNPSHSHHGLAKAQFSAADLLSHSAEPAHGR